MTCRPSLFFLPHLARLFIACLLLLGIQPAQAQSQRNDAWIFELAYSPDGTRIAAKTRTVDCTYDPVDSPVLILDAVDGRVLHSMQGHLCVTAGLAWKPDGTRLVTTGLDGSVIVWDTATGQSVGMYGEPFIAGNAYVAAAWHPLLDQLAFVDGGWIYLLDATTLQELRHLRTGESAWEIAWKPDGSVMAVLGETSISVWNTDSGQFVATLWRGDATNMAWSPDGTQLALSVVTDFEPRIDEIHILDVASKQVVATLPGHDDIILDLAWSPNGAYIASGSADTTVGVWEVATGQQVKTFMYQGRVNAVAWSPDSTHLVYGGRLAGDRANLIEIVPVWDAMPATPNSR